MIDTDTRRLRRTNDTFTTSANKVICAHCGHRDTCPRTDQVKACDQFLPVLPFQLPKGLDRAANTIRLGRAWVDRLKVADTVALYNPTTREIFGHAQVLGTIAGPIAPMLNRHAAANHLMLERPVESAAVELAAYLRKTYGPRLVTKSRQITAIYLLRRREPPASPNFEGDEEDRPAEGGAPRTGQDHGDGQG